jgi:purine-binding chemotaxis protein CheW
MVSVGPVAALLFRVGHVHGAIPVDHVVETMRALPITPLDHVSPIVRGMALIRGTRTPVIDAGALLGVESTAARFVTVRADAGMAAVAVDEVIGLATFDQGALAARPPLLTAYREALFASTLQHDRRLYAVLDAARVVAAAGETP